MYRRLLRIVVPAVVFQFAGLAILAGHDLEQGVNLYGEKKYKEAETAFREAAKEHPDNPEAHYYLGMSLVEQNRGKEAEEHLRKAAEMNPDSDQAHLGLARAYLAQKNHDQAEKALERARQAHEKKVGEDKDYKNPEIYFYSGQMNLHRKQNQAAIENLSKTVELKPDHAMAHYYLGMAYGNSGQPVKMTEHFNVFLKLAPPDSPEAKRVQALMRSVR
jgi:tetratricopeptide (TPR) repeat protein